MNRLRMVVTVGLAGVVLVTLLAGGAVALARVLDDPDQDVTGPEADKAAAAAVDAAGGGGRATAIERDNEGRAVWEVEVTRPDGTLVEVRIDSSHRVVVVNDDREADDASGDDRDTPDDDNDADDAEDDADDD